MFAPKSQRSLVPSLTRTKIDYKTKLSSALNKRQFMLMISV